MKNTMKDVEIFGAIESNAEQAAAREHEEKVAEKRKAIEAKRHEDWAFFIRCLFSFVGFWFCNEAIIQGWMSKGFADFIFGAWKVYFLIYAGAWWQYRFVRGGVLHG